MGFSAPIAAMSLPAHISFAKETLRRRGANLSSNLNMEYRTLDLALLQNRSLTVRSKGHCGFLTFINRIREYYLVIK